MSMKFKGHILVRKVSFYCERAQNRLRGRGWSPSAVMPINRRLLGSMACTRGLMAMEILALADTEPWKPGLMCELVSCPVEEVWLVTFMFLCFQECPKEKKHVTAWQIHEEKLPLQSGFAFISFITCHFQRTDLIACSTAQVTEAPAPPLFRE